MNKLFFKYNYIYFFLCLNLLLGCNKSIRVSIYAKYSKVDLNWYQTYLNDPLKFSTDFYGMHVFEDINGKKKYLISYYNWKILKSLGTQNSARLLFYLRPAFTENDQQCFGYLVSNASLKKDTLLFAIDTTQTKGLFWRTKKLYRDKDKISIAFGAKINSESSLLLIESQSVHPSTNYDSVMLMSNSKDEISSLQKGSQYLTYFNNRARFIRTINENVFSNEYLKPINALKSISEDSVEFYHIENHYYQCLITRESFLDELDTVRSFYHEYQNIIYRENAFNFTKDSLIIHNNAIEYINKIARNQKMIMINESHYDYRHRIFVYLLLDSLFKIGYKNLCLEDKDVSDSNTSFISKDDGYYVREPFMATLVRKAKEIGFNIYAYDDTTNNNNGFGDIIAKREYNQAKNLFELYKKDSTEKWIVFGGYDHINKKSFGYNHKSTYQYFQQLAGFAPYSINQSFYSDILNEKYLLSNYPVDFYTVDTSCIKYKELQADLYIINNIKCNPFDSPFQAINPILFKYNVEPVKPFKDSAYLFIYIQKEYEKLHELTIPVYIGKINKKITSLFLPKNEYIGIITDNTEKEISNCVLKEENK